MPAYEEVLALAAADEPPAPSLLPWAARNAAEGDLPRIARIAAAQTALAPTRRWPAVADATAEVLANREAARPELLTRLANVLPPITAYLDEAQATDLVSRGVQPDAVGYAALTHPGVRVGRPVPESLDPLWGKVLSAGRTDLPPLANLGLLARLADGPMDPTRILPSQAVYLIPYVGALHPGEVWAQMAVAEINSCLEAGSLWYAAALLARVTPYLDLDVRDKTATLPPRWAAVFDRLSQEAKSPWASAVAEIAAAHPATAELDRLAGETADQEVVSACAEIVDLMITQLDPALERWVPDRRAREPGQKEWERPATIAATDQEEPGQVALGEPSYEMGAGERVLLPGPSRRYRLLEIVCRQCGAQEHRMYYDERDHVCKREERVRVVQVVIGG